MRRAGTVTFFIDSSMLVVVMDDQGGGMMIVTSTTTFVDLSMNDNTAVETAPDIYNQAASISCSTSCTAGQYSEQCDIAMTNDNLQCSINCEVRKVKIYL